LGVRAGLDVPTGDGSDGLGSGQLGAHAIGIAALTLDEYAVYANAVYVYTRQPGTRRNLGGFSIALTRPDDRPLRGFVEAATYSNTDPAKSQWPAFAPTGGQLMLLGDVIAPAAPPNQAALDLFDRVWLQKMGRPLAFQ